LLAIPFRKTCTGDEHPGVKQIGPEDVFRLIEDVSFCVLVELVGVTPFRRFALSGTCFFVNMDLFLSLVEAAVPKGSVVFLRVAVLEGFVTMDGSVVMEGLAAVQGFEVVQGYVTMEGSASLGGSVATEGFEMVKGFVVMGGPGAMKGFAAMKGFEAVNGFVPVKGFVVMKGFALVKGFVAIKGFVVLMGLVGTGAFPFVCPLPFARFAHVLPQYGCTTAPSPYLGLFPQCLGG